MQCTVVLIPLLMSVMLVTVSCQPPRGAPMHQPVLPPPARNVRSCVRGSDCGYSGCCLNGKCSLTGGIFDRCYVNLKENGRRQPVETWTTTDLCPCEYTYYCMDLSGRARKHPKYGLMGVCLPLMG